MATKDIAKTFLSYSMSRKEGNKEIRINLPELLALLIEGNYSGPFRFNVKNST